MVLDDKDYKIVQSALSKEHKRLEKKGKDKRADAVQFLMYRIGKCKWREQHNGPAIKISISGLQKELAKLGFSEQELLNMGVYPDTLEVLESPESTGDKLEDALIDSAIELVNANPGSKECEKTKEHLDILVKAYELTK